MMVLQRNVGLQLRLNLMVSAKPTIKIHDNELVLIGKGGKYVTIIKLLIVQKILTDGVSEWVIIK